MIGITAVASAGVYLNRGYIDPAIAMPLVLGISCGSFIASRLFHRVRIESLRLVFSALILAIAVQMLINGVNGVAS